MKIVRATIESITQCVLLPGVELKLDEVLSYMKKGVGFNLIEKVKKAKAPSFKK